MQHTIWLSCTVESFTSLPIARVIFHVSIQRILSKTGEAYIHLSIVWPLNLDLLIARHFAPPSRLQTGHRQVAVCIRQRGMNVRKMGEWPQEDLNGLVENLLPLL